MWSALFVSAAVTPVETRCTVLVNILFDDMQQFKAVLSCWITWHASVYSAIRMFAL